MASAWLCVTPEGNMGSNLCELHLAAPGCLGGEWAQSHQSASPAWWAGKPLCLGSLAAFGQQGLAVPAFQPHLFSQTFLLP